MITLYQVHVVLGFSPENVSQQPLAGLLPPFFPFFPFPPSFLLSPVVCLFMAERTRKPEEGPGLGLCPLTRLPGPLSKLTAVGHRAGWEGSPVPTVQTHRVSSCPRALVSSPRGVTSLCSQVSVTMPWGTRFSDGAVGVEEPFNFVLRVFSWETGTHRAKAADGRLQTSPRAGAPSLSSSWLGTLGSSKFQLLFWPWLLGF